MFYIGGKVEMAMCKGGVIFVSFLRMVFRGVCIVIVLGFLKTSR